MVFAQEAPVRTLQSVQYPLQLNFKLLAFGPQIFVRDSGGRELMFVHQKALKLKEDINVFSDSGKSQQLFSIRADRIIDFSANYRFADAAGSPLGSIKREGMRSLLKASYNILDEVGNIVGHIKEDNPWIRVADYLLNEIPVVGMFTGYLFHPSYTLYRSGSEQPLFRLTKEPAFFEGKFRLEKLSEPTNAVEETRWLLGFLMMILLERSRG